MGKHKKSSKSKGRVEPEDDKVVSYTNSWVTMDILEKNNSKNIQPAKTDNGIELTANVLGTVNRWKNYVTSKRNAQLSSDGVSGGIDRRKTGGIGLCDDINTALDGAKHHPNTDLIQYFARQDEVDLEYVLSIVKQGGDVNCCDKYGQTLLHEVARVWHVDVAKFLIEINADVNRGDNYGRTPLHVAAAVDYPEMINTLVDAGADKEAVTKGERQTPVHFAAKSDACLSLRALIKRGCQYKHVRDYKERTPVHLAAELDRSETARFLLELDDPAPAEVEDRSGQPAISWMICKMPPVAKLALDQFHTTDRANRKQSYHLHKLETRKPDSPKSGYPRSPMQNLVIFKRFDLIEHPVFLYLIDVKWKYYGRLGSITNLLVNTAFIISWTVIGCVVEYDVRYQYNLPSQWWRIFLLILALFFTGWQLKDELSEYIGSRRKHNLWEEWRLQEIDEELKFAHPRWPEEERYLLEEKKCIQDQRPQYFNDFWNIFDWICYLLLLACLTTHFIDIGYHTNFVARLHIRLMALTIILLWIRILKNARAFAFLGPFIVMLTHMFGDILKFFFLYLVFYFPFSCAFWILYGGTKVPSQYQGRPDSVNHTVQVIGMETYDSLLFSLFRITLVDNYDYEGMKSIDSFMADVLCGSWLALSAILMLNLFIALLSDTFQRVYDNAKANAVMQKAITIMGHEETLNQKRMDRFLRIIHKKYAPKEESYDDDEAQPGSEDLQKVTIQIKEQLDEFEANVNNHILSTKEEKNANANDHQVNFISQEVFQKEIHALKNEFSQQQDKMLHRFKHEMKAIKQLLSQLQDTAEAIPHSSRPRQPSIEGPPEFIHTGAPNLPHRSSSHRSMDWDHENWDHSPERTRGGSREYEHRDFSSRPMPSQYSTAYLVQPYSSDDTRQHPRVEVSDQTISSGQ